MYYFKEVPAGLDGRPVQLCFGRIERRLIRIYVPLPDDGIGRIEGKFHPLFRLFEFALSIAFIGHVSSDQ